MTKDWESVRDKIKKLSVDQKKSLQDVQAIMEAKYNFKASTRAYRMRLKEWGYLRYKSRQGASTQRGRSETLEGGEAEESEDGSDQSGAERVDASMVNGLGVEEQVVPSTLEAWSRGLSAVKEILMTMLDAVLDEDAERLGPLAEKYPDLLQSPIGLPFDTPDSRFFDHPAIQNIVLLQHPNQTILDIAAALPSGGALWVLMENGANGSIHPQGIDLALYNAIRNGRTYTVQRLIETGRSYPNGNAVTHWRPLLQAASWNYPDVVRVLLDKGADVNEAAPLLGELSSRTALQVALHVRAREYAGPVIRERSERIIKMLLNAGANIFAPLPEDHLNSTGWLVEPWQNSPAWFADLSSTSRQCLESFIRKGGDLQTPFAAFPCTAPMGNTLMHQLLWHASPKLARALIDNMDPRPEANGTVLHELVGGCPNASRHPSDILSDISTLLSRGADPNLLNVQGDTPLTVCLQLCPPVDLVARLAALLKGGADPELDANGIKPAVYAARTYEEPLRFEVLELLVSHFRGSHSSLDSALWADGLWPIGDDVSLGDILVYCGQNPGNASFDVSMQRVLPTDVIPSFRDAAISVATKKLLAKYEKLVLTSGVPMTASQKHELQHVITLRQLKNLPDYKFSQDFVMALMRPNWNPALIKGDDILMTDVSAQVPTPYGFQSGSPIGVPITQSPAGSAVVFPSLSTDTARFHATPPSHSSPSNSSGATNSFVPDATLVMWPVSKRTVFKELNPAKMVRSDT
ncbi:ankyrin [Westerdykella ornata]|uniref:Ankyrin n=1 Tax=Westerdykella ornata TaxID=318751 RepID=A0A6A6JL79_WESOR|nr:ankyrin [Westerdykella ornata]KAF2277004.1 ankyrin [Westerdykella ornata]